MKYTVDPLYFFMSVCSYNIKIEYSAGQLNIMNIYI